MIDDNAHRLRRSRQIRNRRRRHILRALFRQGVIEYLHEVQRGQTTWLSSPQIEKMKPVARG